MTWRMFGRKTSGRTFDLRFIVITCLGDKNHCWACCCGTHWLIFSFRFILLFRLYSTVISIVMLPIQNCLINNFLFFLFRHYKVYILFLNSPILSLSILKNLVVVIQRIGTLSLELRKELGWRVSMVADNNNIEWSYSHYWILLNCFMNIFLFNCHL